MLSRPMTRRPWPGYTGMILAALMGLTMAAAASVWVGAFGTSASARADGNASMRVGRVTRVERNILVVDQGSDHGVRERMVLDIYQPGRPLRLPLTDEQVLVPYVVVGRAIVVDVEPRSCRARLAGSEAISGQRVRPAAGADKRGIQVGDLAYHNPLSRAKNQAPSIGRVVASQPWAWWGTSVQLDVAYTNEPEDRVCFYWEAEAGKLAYSRTVTPTNKWWPPTREGVHLIRVRIVDSAGHVSVGEIRVESKGFENSQSPLGRRTYQFVRRLGDFSRIVPGCRDVAFDSRGALHILNSSSERLIGMGLDSSKRWTAPYTADLTRFVLRRGACYAIDESSRSVHRYALKENGLEGKPTRIFGKRGTVNGTFERPVDLAVAENGDVYVLDEVRACVQVFDSNGKFVHSFGSPGSGKGALERPVALAISNSGAVLVLDAERRKVLVFEEGRFTREHPAGTSSEQLLDLEVDPISGHFFVLEGTTGSIRRYDGVTGSKRGSFGARGDGVQNHRQPQRLAVGPTQILVVVDGAKGSALVRWDVSSAPGRFLGRWGGYSLAEDDRISCGPKGEVASLNRSTGHVTRLDREGWITARFGGTGQIEHGRDLVVDARNWVFVLDEDKHAVLRFEPAGSPRGSFGKRGSSRLQFDSPIDLGAFRGDVKRLAILQDRNDANVSIWEYEGQHRLTFPLEGTIEDALSVAVGRVGDYFVANEEGQIEVFQAISGSLVRSYPKKLDEVTDMEASNAGHLFVVDYDSGKVLIYEDTELRSVGVLKGGPLTQPLDVAVDEYGGVIIYDEAEERMIRFEARE